MMIRFHVKYVCYATVNNVMSPNRLHVSCSKIEMQEVEHNNGVMSARKDGIFPSQ